MATYPGSVIVFATHHNLTDIVDAADPNVIQAEVAAIESTLGTNPHISSSGGGTWISGAQTFASVSARLANIENGIAGDSHNQYVHKSGGDTVAPTAGVIGLTIQPTGTPSTNVWQINNSLGISQVYVDQSYNLVAGGGIVVNRTNAATTVTTQAAGDAGTVGTSTNYARQDHKHVMPLADDVAGTASFRTLGTGAQQAAAGNHTHLTLAFTTYNETLTAQNASAALSLDASTATAWWLTLTGNVTGTTFTNVPASGRLYSVTLVLQQDATGSRTFVWPATTHWANGSAPVLSTAANAIDVVTLFTRDGGTNWYGFFSGKGMA